MLVKLCIKIKCTNFGYWEIVEQFIVQTILVIVVAQYYKKLQTLIEPVSSQSKSIKLLVLRSFDLLFINESFVRPGDFFLFKT